MPDTVTVRSETRCEDVCIYTVQILSVRMYAILYFLECHMDKAVRIAE